MSVESEMKTLVREKFGNHESEMKQLGRMLREKIDSWGNWRSERGSGSQAPSATQSTTKTCWQCRTEINSQARVCPLCRGKQAGNEKRAVLIVCGIFAVLMMIGAAVDKPSTPTTMTEPDKVRAAVAAQHSCTPSLSYIKFIGSDRTGTGYMAGCGRWLYWVFINPQGKIEASRLTEWNGR
jgi:hypothetical protein